MRKITYNVLSLISLVFAANGETKEAQVIFFLSTGRTGTQYYTKYLSECCGNKALVMHEPLGPLYTPKKTLRVKNLSAALQAYPAVATHFKNIDTIIQNQRIYIETGWPAYSWIPYLIEKYKEKILIVHVVRHPIRCALSFASHLFYSPIRNDEFTQLARLEPTDPGVRFPHYAAKWKNMNEIEKCFFHWLEINTWAEELKAQYPNNFVFLKAEDVFKDSNLLLNSLIKARPSLGRILSKPGNTSLTDGYALKTPSAKTIRIWPEVIALAKKYSYKMELNAKEIRERFAIELPKISIKN